MFRSKIFFLTLFCLVFLLSGCIKFQSEGGVDTGGIFVSTDKGQNWKQMTAVPTVQGQPGSIASIGVNYLALDPSDPNAIYLASLSNGLYYTYNILEGWRKAGDLPSTRINSVAVDPEAKCIIYAGAQNKLFKSTDCSRTWESAYHDDSPEARITAIVIDHYEPNRIFIGNSLGFILKSEDRGVSWSTMKKVDDIILGLYNSPHDSRVMFVTTQKKGIFRSDDKGVTWTSLVENMKEFNNRTQIRDLALSGSEENLIIAATDYGMLKSEDAGNTWSQIELLTPEKKTTINSVAINPQSAQEIYYVTDYTFYRSLNGGESWSTKALPTIRPGSGILLSPDNSNVVYLGIGSSK